MNRISMHALKLCNCIELADRELAGRHTRLVCSLALRDSTVRAVVATEVTEAKRGRRAMTVVATYCPFCGKKYPERKAR